MAKHMEDRTQALCYFYRNTPSNSNARRQKYKDIPKLIGQPRLKVSAVKMSVRRFKKQRQKRGRRCGWKKTTVAEDKQILATFHRVRKPLGSLCECNDVWKGLTAELREKVPQTSSLSWLRP